LRFIFDNQLSPHLANGIHALSQLDGHQVVHLRDKFAPDSDDVVWLEALAREGAWVIICGDMNILRARAERLVWESAGLIGFFLKKGWMNQGPWEQMWRLVKWWPMIVAQAERAEPGSAFGVGVNPNGRLDRL
jgi:PIN like domain